MPHTPLAAALAASGLPPFDFADLDRASLLKVLGVAVERIASLVMTSNGGYSVNGGDPFGLREEARVAAREGLWRWVAATEIETPSDTSSVVALARLSESSLPSLPTELRCEILSHCNKATLSSYCQASSSSLELASPMLWTDVALEGNRAVDAFIRIAQPSCYTPLLASLLPRFSLDCVQTLALPHLDSPRKGALRYPSLRLPSLHTLRINVCYRCSLSGLEGLVLGLNPKELVLHGLDYHSKLRHTIHSVDRWISTLAGWTDLALIRVAGSSVVLPYLFQKAGLSAGIAPIVWDMTELNDWEFEPSTMRIYLGNWLTALLTGDPADEPWSSPSRELDVLVSGETHRTLVQRILDELQEPGSGYADLGYKFVVRT